MPNISISIDGQVIVVPGVYTSTQVTPAVPSGSLPTGPLVFLAAGYGGMPFTPIECTSNIDLQNAMRGSPSTSFIEFMFNPSSEVNGTSLVTYINVAPNTQSSASLVSSGNTAVINMLSVDYGTPSNLLEYSISAGSSFGVAMTIVDNYSGAAYTANNLGVPCQLSYTGAASGVTYTVQSTITGQATKLVVSSPNPGESLTLDLTSPTFSNVSNVVQYLNGTGYYSCLMFGNGLLPSSYLDITGAIALPKPVATVNQYVNVTATLGDIVNFINTIAASTATANIATGIQSNPGYIPIFIGQQFFSGGTNGVPSLANYASGFNVALNTQAWAIIADTNSAGVQALGAQHAATASSVLQAKWRRFVTGSALSESATTAQTNARSINELMVTYCWPGIWETNTTTGLNQVYDGNHVAAAVAGIMTGNSVPTPLTNKTLLGNGVEQMTSLGTLSQLQNNGVLVLNYPISTRIPTLLSDVTTWQNDSNPANVFNQQVACRFALNYYIVNQLQPYVGTIASNYDTTVVANAVKTLLNQLIYNGQSSIGILNSWDPNSLIIAYDGTTQTLSVAVNVVFVGQNLFISVTVTVNPLTISLNSQGVITNG